MKPSLLTLSLLLFAVAFAFSNGEQVLEDDGDPVVTGVAYSLAVPSDYSDGMSIVLGQTGNSSCPVTVLEDSPCGYVKFSIPGGENNSAVFTNHPLDIEFTKKPKCAESSKWIVHFDNEIQRYFVGIGGPKDHPGQQILNGTFRIQQDTDASTFVFCLEQPVEGSPTCFIIGQYIHVGGDDARLRLILVENQHEEQVVYFSINGDNFCQPGIRTVV